MWIFQNDSFVSVVQDREHPERLLVRSRIEGDIERLCPKAQVFELDRSDYRYRAFVGREEIKEAMLRAIDEIDYDNFKGSIPEEDFKRHRAYMRVWTAMADAYGCYGQPPK